MNLGNLLGIGTIFGYAIFSMFIAVAVIYLLVAKPNYLFLILATVVVFFNSQTSGAIGADANTIYYRGSGLFYFPLVTWMIFGGFSVSMLWLWVIRGSKILNTSVTKVYWSLFALCVSHILVGWLIGITPAKLFSNNGLFPLFLSVLIFLWGTFLPMDKSQIRLLVNFLVVGTFARSLFGLGRYAILGGDPVNIYENIEKLGTKVVFFDFHDSTLAAFLVLFSLAYLLIEKPKSHGQRFFYFMSIVAGTFVIVLSQHRASLLGLLLGSLVLVAFVQPRQRFLLFSGVGLSGFAGLAAITMYRLSKIKSGPRGMSALLYDFIGSTGFGPETARALESKQAFATVVKNPILGVGSWGKYQGYGIGWQDRAGEAGYETVHNGFLQIAFKSGMIGFSLICLLFILHARACFRFLRESAGWYRCAHIAAFGTFVAMLPNFSIGMVMAQQRGLFLMALLIFLPYAIRAAQGSSHALAPVPPRSPKANARPVHGRIKPGEAAAA